MKRCPTCEKTFDDNLRFCQADGTPLVDAVEELDPFKTMVARPGEFSAAIPPADKEPEPADLDADVLELPSEQDANRTQIVSDSELRAEMEKADAAESEIVDLPPINDAAPEPPKFNEPSVEPPPAFSGTPQPPRSPFAADPPKQDAPARPSGDLTGDPFAYTTPPIPSPFGDPRESTPEPNAPQFAEPEAPKFNEPSLNPFEQSAGREDKQMEPAQQWKPPAAPDANWQGKEIGENTPFQPPPAGAEGQNKTLAIVSLVVSILSIPCCGLIIVGIVGAITGFIARGKANSDPNTYGGKGLATAAIVIGVITTLIGILTNTLAFMGFIQVPNF
ncbi:hypothetical protein BH24ACI3_BH24ACI3_15700 [soil metagenome]